MNHSRYGHDGSIWDDDIDDFIIQKTPEIPLRQHKKNIRKLKELSKIKSQDQNDLIIGDEE